MTVRFPKKVVQKFPSHRIRTNTFEGAKCYTQISRPEIVTSKAGFVRCELAIAKVHVRDLGAKPSKQGGNLEDAF